MGSPALSQEYRRTLLGNWQSIYDEHRFLDAYKASAEYWTESTCIDDLSAEEMIFAGRLASRLGGFRLSRHLYRKAHERDPELPVVRYFTRHISGPGDLLLDDLLKFEKNPELGGNDADLRASWQAAHAYTFGVLRDFARARELLSKAHEISPGSPWILSQEADILGMADCWRDSLASAERGCQADPKSPWPALAVATALLNLDETEEAARRLSQAAESTQCFQIVQAACWYHCALAETREGDERNEILHAARKLAGRVELMAPLGDREFKTSLARTWLDLAEMSDDHAAMEHWASQAPSPFHRSVLANLKANPHGKRVRLSYRRTIQKHAECVPASISSALSATGASVSVDELARAVTFGGTAEWAAADWLREKGFHVRFFSATAEVTARLIAAGIGFTVSWDDDEGGHCVAIVGIDHAAGTVIAHDPTSFRSTEYLLSAFTEDYGPLGIPAMAAVPASRAAALDAILPPEAGLMDAAEAQRRALWINGPAAARTVVNEIEAQFPDHPGTRYLRAIQDLEDGRVGRALGGFRGLLEKFSHSPVVRSRLMSACRSLGHTALLRETLRSVLETGKVPGMESGSDWVTPHARYFGEYADLLRFSAETRAQAESLLRSVLRKDWRSASAWHVLADLRWGQKDGESAVLAYRIAATLAEHNEHYASAYADVLCRDGQAGEAMEWMRSRAEKLGTSVHGVSTWTSYVGILEDWGNPDRALEVCRNVLARFGASASLLAFAVPFFARMGQWEEAARWFEALRETDAGAILHEAAVYFFEMRGMTVSALEHAEAWVSEVPLSTSARNRLLILIARVHGGAAAVDRAAQWMRERPDNEDFEDLFCQHVEFPVWRKLRVLKARVKRNTDDAWAWRELAFAAIYKFQSADDTHRQRLQPRIVSYLAECDRLTTADAATFRCRGLWHEAQCNWKTARECYLESIRLEPDHSWGYRRLFEISARFPMEEERAVWAEIEAAWMASSGHLSNCLEMMRQLNNLFGPRETEQIIAKWQERRPDDPNVAEAMADLLLDFGHGRSDAGRALELLQPAVARHPYDSGLRFSLARAWRATGDDRAAGRVFEELVRRRPDNLAGLIQLAWIHEREGRTDEALRVLTRAAEQEPQNPDPVDARAQILIENRRFDEALSLLEDALRRLPDSVRIYQRTIALFAQIGEDEKAVEAARQGVRNYPRGAYLWLLLGRTLRDYPQLAAPGEIEHCLWRSLQLNHGLYESADVLSMILTEQRRYDEAFRVLSDVERRVADPSEVLGRRAWITYQTGKKQEAITEMAGLLERFPGYAWGWSVLIDWLEENKAWERARKLLGPVPPQMIANVTFRKDRLLLLEESGAEAASLDAEWLRLLNDFPEEAPLHLRRYDSLRDAKRWEEAAATLERVAPVAADDVYFLARLADARCNEKKFDEALECAMKVCFAPVEHSVWPVNRVWEVFGSAKKDKSLADGFRARLDQGAQPTRRALSRYAEYLLGEEGAPTLVSKLIRQTRLNPVARKIVSLVKTVERSAWRDEFHAADLFAILNTQQYSRLVIRFWKEMSDQGLGGQSDAWAEAGRAMVHSGRYRMARGLFRDWRSRRGVLMWSLANYMQSLSRFRGRDLTEVIATCRDALADLPHDHCARYLACMQAEACALAGDKEGLLAVWSDRRGYFDSELKSGEYFKSSQKRLMHDIPQMIEALERDDRWAYRKLVWRLRLQRLWNQDRRRTVVRAWRIVARVIVVLWAIGMIVSVLRH
jgi:tetratricopeptide (TPR) repeat protein